MSAANALLTIVVPIRDREQLARPTLDSIAAQTLRPLRVIIVDNGSTDGTREMLDQWKAEVETPAFAVDIYDEPTIGAAAARECGLRHVTTEYTMFFDSDDLMAPVHAALAVDAFVQNPLIDLVGWDVEVGRSDGRLAGARHQFYDTDVQWHNIMHGSLATQRYAARTSLFRAAGGWNRALRGWDDIELAARMLKLSPRIQRLTGDPTVIWRRHKHSISGLEYSSRPERWEGALKELRKVFADEPRQLRYVGLKGAVLAGDYWLEGSKADAKRLMGELLAQEKSPLSRMLLRVAFRLRSRGTRGVARLLRPFY